MASVTIYDVARAAGVSIKTVSRVMNGLSDVKPTTRERVQAHAVELGYHPNLSARSLAGSRSFIIAVFADAGLTLSQWRSERGTDYLARVQLGATARCRAYNYHLLVELIDYGSPHVAADISRVLGALKPDGVILTPPSADDPMVHALLQKARTPYVRLGAERADGGGLRLRLEDRAAAYALTEHLIGLGHRRIGFLVGEPSYGSSQARRRGFEEAMAAHGLDTPADLFAQGDYTFESGLAGGKVLLAADPRPTAVFASNDDMAMGCMAAADELGLSIPDDLSIAGYDDSSGARFSRPQLTTVRQPLTEMAAYAVSALIDGGVTADSDAETAPGALPSFELALRRSTAPPA